MDPNVIGLFQMWRRSEQIPCKWKLKDEDEDWDEDENYYESESEDDFVEVHIQNLLYATIFFLIVNVKRSYMYKTFDGTTNPASRLVGGMSDQLSWGFPSINEDVKKITKIPPFFWELFLILASMGFYGLFYVQRYRRFKMQIFFFYS